MFGAGFDAGDTAPEGMEILSQATHMLATLADDSAPSHGLSEVAESGPGQENADPGTTPGATTAVATNKGGGEGWPEWSTIDLERLNKARAFTVDNQPENHKLTGYKPASARPRHTELWWAIMERNSNAHPKGWKVYKCVEWLCKPENKPKADRPGVVHNHGEQNVTTADARHPPRGGE